MAGERILIVEDNQKNRKLLRDVLQFNGYQILESETGEKGVEMARSLAPHLVLMDIQLPGMNGVEALAALRADPATHHIPVIAVTASAMLHDMAKIKTAGFDAYQSKPIHIKEILALVRETLDGANAGGGR